MGGTIAKERNNSDEVQKEFYGFGEWRNGVGNLYYARDPLRNLRELTDNSNAVRVRYEYDPYGRRTKVSGNLEALGLGKAARAARPPRTPLGGCPLVQL